MGIRERLRGSDDPTALGRKLKDLRRKAKRDARASGRAGRSKAAELKRRARQDLKRADQKVTRESVGQGLKTIGGRLSERAGELEVDGMSDTGRLEPRERQMFAGAEEAAMAGPPVQDATLEPVSAPEQTGVLFGGEGDMAVDSLVMGSSSERGVDDLLTSGQSEDEPGGIDDLVVGGGRDGR